MPPKSESQPAEQTVLRERLVGGLVQARAHVFLERVGLGFVAQQADSRRSTEARDEDSAGSDLDCCPEEVARERARIKI